MEKYPLPAQPLVAEMEAQAAANPARAAAFQGAPGANSHVAVAEALPDATPLPCFSFEDAIDAVREGKAGRAVIPIENSLYGRVADMHFLLPESGLSIVGEHFLVIRHAMMGLGSVDNVKQAISHPQALGQCRHWLRARGIDPLPYDDTAGAAARVVEMGDKSVAALAPAKAAQIYGLNLLAENLADSDDNITRFVILAPVAVTVPDDVPAMTSFIFEVKNIPAALFKALSGFATNGVNMTKLESYQVGASFAATTFFADIEGRPEDPAVARALEELQFYAKSLRILGTYAQARKRG